ncbi:MULTISPECIES: SRPBCC family protein [Methylobacterium]|uniref:IS1595 family transposase ISMpo2 n=1 Tax=Methylobacterium jeotgali TaxID=381630 RepID=A0ABQ4T0I4_9HYPH|nr:MULTISPECIES: SRPBCC family protein [Methylobacterium]PIU05370.1 MAG: SRPBCC family protein [Methylobacterium sp. CG09_land_8_20_14_0_10_71_15]PIU12167.1 MAG: SRPBCC family protein [Methylobacterium sp. CG08_land_8_20_14_0_20_71_15]GBU19977.1 MxaD family protein [Methylobacterium sp.]GJE08970.1 IS1595 family transposase ISMpo2 [Methylobacterium jeotgali]
MPRIRPHVLLPILLAAATPARAIDIAEKTEIAAAPDKVWAAIGDFCGIQAWHPAVAGCTISQKEGKPVRTLALKGGGSIVEEQVSRDDKVMSYSYTILESPLPVSDYTSTLMVAPNGSGATVNWSGSFNPKGVPDTVAKDVISGIYTAGLKGLAETVK